MPRPSAPRPDVVALLRACKELPDEDVHRLVLSDWLEENADDPAEIALRDLIRSQVESDGLPAGDVRRGQLTAGAAALLRQHGKSWLGSLDTDRVNWGMVHGLFVMTAHEEDLSNDRLGTPGFPEGWAWVERLTVLCTSSSDYGALAQAEQLGRIGTLDLNRNKLGVRGAQALARSPRLAGLCGLILSRTDLGRQGLEAITTSPHLTGLVRLELDDNGLDAASMAALGDWAGKGNLLRLSLAGNSVGPALGPLMAGAPFGRLVELNLRDCQLRIDDLAALAAAPLRVRRLDLSRNQGIDSDGLIALLSAGWIGELERLDLSRTSVGAVGMRALAACERLTNLRHLACANGSPFDARSLRSIVFSPHWKNLQCLDVRRTGSRYSQDELKAARKRGLTILY
jgi:uncharacterized protein (TIGR02996 family)